MIVGQLHHSTKLSQARQAREQVDVSNELRRTSATTLGGAL